MSLTLLFFVISLSLINSRNLTYSGKTYTHNDTIISDILTESLRDTISGVNFGGVFGSKMVLQREPYIASLYGQTDTNGVTVNIVVYNEDTNKISENLTAIAVENSNRIYQWKVLLSKAYPNGGTYKISVTCNECNDPNTNQVLYNVTFGDVYYCSGQSNMELDMHYTFARNTTYDDIRKHGKYSNIRISMPIPGTNYAPSKPIWILPFNNTWEYSNNINTKSEDTVSLDTFSSTCWYFGQSLYDNYDITDINIGLISTAVGGSMIESWIMDNTVNKACKQTICPSPQCGGLFNGWVAPYVNMTIKGVLWYQGENNIYEADSYHGNTGSWVNSTGYACMQQLLINQWRGLWSKTEGTTNSEFPFGLVLLAAGTDEGWPQYMGPFRWSQTENYDLLPNVNFKNVFFVTAHDGGEPWGDQCIKCNEPNAPYSFIQTPQYLGPIHPRDKLIVGQRLAQASVNIFYPNVKSEDLVIGPLISGCDWDKDNNVINLYFNETLLMGNDVTVSPPDFWYDPSLNNKPQLWEQWSGIEVQQNNDAGWTSLPIHTTNAKPNQVIIDLTGVTGTVLGVRYAWITYPCCGILDINTYPCPPNSCAINAGKANRTMPAVPFWAEIDKDTLKCKCFYPQTC